VDSDSVDEPDPLSLSALDSSSSCKGKNIYLAIVHLNPVPIKIYFIR
jgi:hypothetical protein